MKYRRVFLLVLVSVFVLQYYRCNNSIRKGDCLAADHEHWVQTTSGCLRINTYKSDSLSEHPNLVLVIHGDAPFNKPGYQYKMARIIAEQNKNTIAVGILRPGYTDSEDHVSDGRKGFTTGDNYTPEVIESIAQAIQFLQNQYHPAKTILIGHSGGAAITGDLIGVKPTLVNAAVLISCPCNVPKWRKQMGRKQFYNPGWLSSVSSISPHEVADKIDPNTRVLILIGEKDDVTPLELSQEYEKQLQNLHIPSQLIQIPNEGHEIFLNDTVFNAIRSVLML